MAEITWGPASAAEVDALYAGRPRETVRALVIRVDGKPAGIIGLAQEPDRLRAFSEVREALCPHLRRMPVLRAIMAFMRWVRASKVPVYAVSEGTGLLERLGFVQLKGEEYRWPSSYP
jgi:hypothetical protein